jgi:hypothetical protein
MIDLSVPNEFYKNIKEVVFEPELFLTEPTIQLIQTIVALRAEMKKILMNWTKEVDLKTFFNDHL